MFTGLVQKLGTLTKIEVLSAGKKFWIQSSLDARHLKKGASVAVNGACLTVEDYSQEEGVFACTSVVETLDKTQLGDLELGDQVHLERSLTLETPLGGHLVSGHVDGTAEVLESGPTLKVKVPADLKKFLPKKGSVTLNGVSLTIAEMEEDRLTVALIPETLQSTRLGFLKKGDKVNLEVDILARYLDQLQKT